MQVKDIMSRSIKTVSSSTQLNEVVSLMCLYRYSGLPVVDDGKLVGIISEKDVLHRLLPNVDELMSNMSTIDFDSLIKDYSNVINLKVTDLMTTGVASVTPDMHILKAAAIMAGKRFRRIPVTEGDKLVGMLSLGDVHKAIFHKSISSNLSAA
ncbi:MAG: CBS domain-containing protein [Gammaproteobacteria bacterium]|nr:CBS domain-containing protein [Gammaproteobacteria bacterium]